MRRFLASLALMLGAAPPVGADTIEQRLAAELQAQGYEIVEANRTWLGRLRVLAETEDVRREIVVDPGTGEILRDYSTELTAPERREREQARSTGGQPPPQPPAAVSGEETVDDDASAPAHSPSGGDSEALDDEPAEGDEPDAPDDDPPDDDPPVDDPPAAIPLLPTPLIPAESE